MRWKDRAGVGLIETQNIGSTHKVRVYSDRLAIWRQDGKRLTWEEVQEVKQMVWGNTVAVEVYPAQADVVNERHTRHLWSTSSITDAVAVDCAHPEFNHTPTPNVTKLEGEL